MTKIGYPWAGMPNGSGTTSSWGSSSCICIRSGSISASSSTHSAVPYCLHCGETAAIGTIGISRHS
jgi:hypothetical protein